MPTRWKATLGPPWRAPSELAVLLAVFAIGFALWLGRGISRRITNDVKTLRSALDRVAAGDLEVTVKVVSRDELGQMADALTQVIAQERQVVTATEQIAQGNLSASVALRGEHDARGRRGARLRRGGRRGAGSRVAQCRGGAQHLGAHRRPA